MLYIRKISSHLGYSALVFAMALSCSLAPSCTKPQSSIDAGTNTEKESERENVSKGIQEQEAEPPPLPDLGPKPCYSPCPKDKICLNGGCQRKTSCQRSCRNDNDCASVSCSSNATYCNKEYPNKKFGRCWFHSNNVTCPYRCKESLDCQVKACGDRRWCYRGFCVAEESACLDACYQNSDCKKSGCKGDFACQTKIWGRQGYCVALRAGQCPAGCNDNMDCRVKGCGLKIICNPNTFTCSAPYEQCPFFCTSNVDCAIPGCGKHTFCTNGKCTSQCPSTCKIDEDCQKTACGNNKVCLKFPQVPTGGTCIFRPRRACPSFCQNHGACRPQGCNDRLFCYRNKCTAQLPPECPDTCKVDSDCSSPKCGKRQHCINGSCSSKCPSACQKDAECSFCGVNVICVLDRTKKSNKGSCRLIRTGNCPTYCTSDEECQVKSCGKKLYCNAYTSKCVERNNYCCKNKAHWADCGGYASCQADNDCKKCGPFFSCQWNRPTDKTGYCHPLKNTACPKSCSKDSDCAKVDCLGKVHCSSQKKVCVNEINQCPAKCASDADCPASKCGKWTICDKGICSPK